jgi:DNA-binding NarL/FixJ family response regulator
VTAMVVQANAAQFLPPDPARESLTAIKETGKKALGDLRDLLGVLDPSREARRDRLPGLTELPLLIEQTRAAGQPVSLIEEGRPPAALAAGRELTAYRVAQESLTNPEVRGGPSHGRPPGLPVVGRGHLGQHCAVTRTRQHRPGGRPRRPVRAPIRRADRRLRAWADRPAGTGGAVRRLAVGGAGRRRRLHRGRPSPGRGSRMISVLVCDDQALVRTGFVTIFDAQPDLTVVGEASDGKTAVDLARRLRPDVVVMDVRMPVMDGIEATRALAGAGLTDPAKVLVVTTFNADEYVYEALRAGASGFLLKDADPPELVDAVRTVARGDALLAPAVTRRLIGQYADRIRPATSTATASTP